MQFKKLQLEPDMEQQNASKLGKVISRLYTCKVIQLYPYKCPFFFKLFSHLGETTYFSLLGVCCCCAQSCLTLCDPLDCSPPGSSVHGTLQARILEWVGISFSRVGSLFLLQGIFPTQELNWRLLHCRQILYQLSYKGSSRILEWVAYPFSRGSS